MGLLDKKKSLLNDEQSHWGDVANRLSADISNYGGSALRGLLKGTVGLPVGLHNLVSDVTGRGTKIDTLSPEWIGDKLESRLPAGNPKTEIAGEFINPLGVMKAASIPLMGLMFAGKGAKTADLFKLRKAEEMLKKGGSDRDAYAETGWTHGFADKNPRFEIDDSGSKFKIAPNSLPDPRFPHYPESMRSTLEHSKLYENYPDFSSIKVDNGAGMGYGGSFNKADNTISISSPNKPTARSIALHELQHGVQHKEGFAGGGSPDMAFRDKGMWGNEGAAGSDVAFKMYADRIKSMRTPLSKEEYAKQAWQTDIITPKIKADYKKYLSSIKKKITLEMEFDVQKSVANDWYKSLAGEAEARLTQKRMNMTAAERAKSYPPDMFDVPVEDQIVRFDGGKQMMSELPKTDGEIRSEIAQLNAAKPISEGGLGLTVDNMPMDRAGAMGFDTPAYHGTNQNIKEFYPNTFFTTNPKSASSYAEERAFNNFGENANVIPLLSNVNKVANSDDVINAAKRAKVYDDDIQESYMYTSPNNDNFSERATPKVISELKKQGFDSAEHYDFDMNDNPIKSLQIFNPANIRSRFAAFDPFRRHEADILAGVGVGGAGFGTEGLLSSKDKKKKKKK